MALKKTVTVPDRDCEYWDLTEVSKNENYAINGAVISTEVDMAISGSSNPQTGAYNTLTWSGFSTPGTSLLAPTGFPAATTTFTLASTGKLKGKTGGHYMFEGTTLKQTITAITSGTESTYQTATNANPNIQTKNTFRITGATFSTNRWILGATGTFSVDKPGRVGIVSSAITANPIVTIRIGSQTGPIVFGPWNEQTQGAWSLQCLPGVTYYYAASGTSPFIDFFTGWDSYNAAQDYEYTPSVGVSTNLSGPGADIRTYSGIFSYISGLSNPQTTDWASYAGDVSNSLIAYNLKSYTRVWDGRPTNVATKARNLNVSFGPTDLSDTAGGAFNYLWLSYTNGNNSGTVFQRLNNPAITINPATVFPAFASFFNSFRDRFSGHFDASGSPVVAVETAINQITVFKASLGTFAFTGYSPIILNSTEFLRNELFTFGDNVVFYTKDTTGQSTNKFARRGTTIYCRIERDNYATEYTACSGLTVKFLELAWYVGNRSYLIYRDGNCASHTLQSATYQDVNQESISGTATPQSVGYQTVIIGAAVADTNLISSVALNSLSYVSVVVTRSVADVNLIASVALQSLAYVNTVVSRSVSDTNLIASTELNFLNYVYDPINPPIPPVYITVDAGTESITGTGTPQAIVYDDGGSAFSSFGTTMARMMPENYDDTTGTWTDNSGNGKNLGQLVSGQRPSKVTGMIGSTGLPCLSFDGVNDFLSALWGVPSSATGFTVAMVINPTSASNQFIMSSGILSNDFYLYMNGGSPNKIESIKAGLGGDTASSNQTLTGSKILVITVNGSNNKVYINGVQVASNTGGTWSVVPTTIYLGANFLGTSEFEGYIGDVVIYSGVIADPVGLSNMMKIKWGL